MIAAIHNLEAGLRFTAHLHNGDLLTARIVLVPSRQPKTGSSPFDWAFSATDALMTKVNGTWKTVQEWSLPAIFWKCEMYNGEGNEQNDMPVTLPPWFRPKKLVEMF